MLGIILGTLYHVNGVLHTIFQKKIAKLVSSQWALGTHLLFLPFGLLGISIAYYYDDSPISGNLWTFFGLVFLFGLAVSSSIYIGFGVLRNMNTSSFFKYTTGLKLLLALLSDFYFFHTLPTYLTLIAVTLLLISGSLLNNTKQKDLQVSLLVKLFTLSFTVVISTTILKQIVLITTNDFLSIFVTQTLTQLIVGLFGIRLFATGIYRDAKFLQFAIIYNFLIVTLVIIEFYAFRYLSVFIIIALSNIKFVLFLLFDFVEKELSFKREAILGIVLGFCAIALLLWSKI